ncbi:Low temperature viability protein-domain-containing protein [Phascolomyces articulosus]|uniref:Low temperature viability protein-domain-containing protein n=1 Tax=Phascolomyces articulosus TaxID=60185 RepID=A0AAD5JQV1_9FUNG|nr:Low temperature viability protein-domain-containing protein [Phascolomyces articulosus]
MGRKPFIDRKEAKHYHVVHRSQKDPLINDTEASDRVLKEIIPSNLAKHKTQAEIDQVRKKPEKMDQDEIDRRVGQAAMQGIYFDDTAEYDYTQHLRTIGEDTEAMFLEAPQKPEKSKKSSSSALKFKDDEEDSKDRTLIELPADVLPSNIEMNVGVMNQTSGLEGGLQPDMDPRLREIMEALEDEEYVDDALDEDFFDELDAEGDPYVHEEYEDEEYEEEMDEGNYNWEAAFRNFQRGKQRRGSDSDFSDEDVLERQTKYTGFSVSSSVMHRNPQLTLLDDRFDKIEEEYLREEDEDEYYEQQAQGQTLEERADFESILDDFLDNYEIVGKKMQPKLDGESGQQKLDTIREALAATHLTDDHKKNQEDDNESVDTVTARSALKKAHRQHETEHLELWERPLKKREAWDCQSVLSTYTNLENHPHMISDRGPRKKITINPKTGMPNLVEAPRKKKNLVEDNEDSMEEEEEEDSDEEEEEERINLGERRSKAESKEEKKARKAAVKEAKKNRRETKKSTKQAFKDEENRQRRTLQQQRKAKGVTHIA